MDNAPSLRLDRVHIRGLRGIERLDLPEEGMGWEGRSPPVAMLGGANGSGKTTLLRCIAAAASQLGSGGVGGPSEHLGAAECRLDFSIRDAHGELLSFNFVVGEEAFVASVEAESSFGFRGPPNGRKWYANGGVKELVRTLSEPALFARSSLPRVVFFPSDTRELVLPSERQFHPAQLREDAGFVAWWNRSLGTSWKGSTMELLSAARWADLNAKENNRPDDAVNFEAYSRAFSEFTAGKKRLGWTNRGELQVFLTDGSSHNLDELSAGERQIVLLLAELRRYWRPCSLILIDEPELHLHDAWQGRLYETIVGMQRELGGQVILTTQSHSLFAMADEGTCALLGRSPLR